MSFDLLRAKVREKLQLRAHNITVSISRVYTIDDADGSSRHFITDDHEVELFVQMRRKIEEVNLCVTVTLNTNGIAAELPRAEKVQPALTDADGEEDDTSEDEDSENDETGRVGVECATPLCTVAAPPHILWYYY